MQTKLEATLAKLVSIPSSVTNDGAAHEIIAYVRTELEPYGLFIHENLETSVPWLIATTQDTMEPDILLAAHLDVVPAATDLFTMQKRDGNFYGRGVFDMKFAAACYLEFFKTHADVLRDLNIGVLFTTDEELNSASMGEILETGLRPKVVFLPDGGEDWKVEKRVKGLYGISLTAHGKAAHGSRPWEGKSAVHSLIDALQQLREKYPSDKKSEATLAVNTFTGGDAINQIPAHASASIDFRSFSDSDLTEYKQVLAELIKTYDLDMQEVNIGVPLIFDETAPVVQSFMRTLRKHRGEEIQFCESYGASDARYFAALNIPTILIEPTGGGRHSADEWLKADDLYPFYQLLEEWLLTKNDTPLYR